jgi:hypothetical protein
MNLFYLFPDAGHPGSGRRTAGSFDAVKPTDAAEQIVPAVWFGMVEIWRTR